MKILSSLFLLLVFPLVGYSQESCPCETNSSVAIANEEGRALGSGTVFFAKGKTYVLTCGHLFPQMRSSKVVNGKEKITFGYPRVYVVNFDDDGNEVDSDYVYSSIVAYSAPEELGGIDLALLEVGRADFLKVGAKFVQNTAIVKPGLEIYHVGNMFGIPGCFITGHVSRTGVKVLGTSFNMVNLNGRPGSSGGGVFAIENKEYVYIGMVVRGDSGGIMLLKSPQMIRIWLREQGYEFVIDRSSVK